jgi:hypothetical protein
MWKLLAENTTLFATNFLKLLFNKIDIVAKTALVKNFIQI